MEIELKIADENDVEIWDKIVESSPHGTLFHTWKWLKTAEKHTRTKLYPLIGTMGSTIIGIFPIFYKKKIGINLAFSPPPYSAMSYLGPILLNYENIKENKRLDYLIEFQKSVDNFIFSELNSNFALVSLPLKMIDSRPFKWTGYHIEPVFHYFLDLTQGHEFVWKQFKKGLRDNVKSAIKKGGIFENGNKKDLIVIYNSLIDRYKQQNKTVYVTKEYLLDLYDLFYPTNLKIFVVKYNGEYAGGIVALCFKDTISFWIGGAKTNISGFYSNDLLHWESIKWACEQGFKSYVEFGAGTERLARFKSKYNPSLIVCFSAKKYSNQFIRLIELIYNKVRIRI